MLDSFEHKVLRFLRKENLEDSHALVACSGGLDSMSLLEVLYNLRKLSRMKISTFHAFHGYLGKEEQDEYRLRALQRVKQTSDEKKLDLFIGSRGLFLKNSEKDLRDFRYEKMKEVLEKMDGKRKFIFLAHHKEDLLETRLLRLIRGTGLQGVQSMMPKDLFCARPFLCVEKKEISFYAKKKKIPFLKDPSNEENDPLRNWLRNEWLPSLEKKRPGSIQSLSRSLETLTLQKGLLKGDEKNIKLDKRPFLLLSLEEKKSHLASYMRESGMKNYTQNHILEVLKRMKEGGEVKTFFLLDHYWRIDNEKIAVSKTK